MAAPVAAGLTYPDLDRFPDDDGKTYELIGGDLFVSPQPVRRHGHVAARVARRLIEYADRAGGEAYVEPGVYYSARDYVAPDVAYVTAETLAGLDPRHIDATPELLVEVSSPSTRHLDLVRKRALYEEQGVPEYWFVDLDAERIEVYRLEGGRYGHPLLAGRGDTITPPLLPGLAIDVTDVLGAS